ncbi:luciferase family oxidoreductase group 1 [Virgibacillus natechei]|uniref:Luciferase family oxidoreductase group 1 n=1 Tax=Virgibacillus natechei TaxID=1216297 RepID=A0ABS4IG94_9BACI|nr:LLM class flavin-dependent oxidoreductase [Virgibacillus natechei]MBP1969476.1 luciferase family oxidoreductase group 1 [Virgibacillus natechei]UZD11819.1 LLM class flavin-dependent oxidoreductase [Virgibacillus natechei]
MRLSILDQSPISSGKTAQEALRATVELAKHADELGYTRYWVAEHHDLSGLASPAPDIMLGIIGSQTERIRIGAGAVLLPHYKPYNIAERYNMLATLYPGRVDLGIGRAPGGSAEVTMALSDNFLEQVRKMPESLSELLTFLHDDFPKDHMFSKITAAPVPEELPDPWLLGTSEKSAILAAEKGIPYAFGHFMTDQDGPQIVKTYHERFPEGKAIIAVSVICAETTEEAEELALSNFLWKVQQEIGEGKDGVPSVEEAKAYKFSNAEKGTVEDVRKNTIIGNPPEVKQQLQALQLLYGTDEFMIVTITHNYETRKKSYELIAKEFGSTIS